MPQAFKLDPAWEFLRKSREALDALSELMAEFATAVQQDDPALQIPFHAVKSVKRNLNQFQENFRLLVHQQKQKAARR